MPKIITQEEIIKRFIEVHGYRFDYSKVIYRGYHTKVIIICPIHGEFEQTPADHLGGHCCFKCMGDTTKLRLSSNLEEFIPKARKVHGDNNDYSKFTYVNNRTKGCITCLVDTTHGDYWQSPNSHLNGKGCPKCYYIRVSLRCLSNVNEFKEKAYKKHNSKYGYNDFIYKGNKIKGKIKCNICGYIFEQTPDSHLQGQGCPRCKKSKGELAIIDILDKNDIDFKDEYKLPEVEDNYRYDFYLPDYRTLIEFHGKQHYEYRPHFHRKGEDEFLANKNTDDIKKDNAYRFKYRFLEFNYKQLNRLSKEQFEELVMNKITTGFLLFSKLSK